MLVCGATVNDNQPPAELSDHADGDRLTEELETEPR